MERYAITRDDNGWVLLEWRDEQRYYQPIAQCDDLEKADLILDALLLDVLLHGWSEE